MLRSALISLIAVAFASIAPASLARAENTFTEGTTSFTSTHFEISLYSSERLRAPSVGTDAGVIRIRYPNMRGWMRLDLESDGEAIEFIRVRRGANNTGVVMIKLTDDRVVHAGDVRVHVNGTVTQISVPLSVLPRMHRGVVQQVSSRATSEHAALVSQADREARELEEAAARLAAEAAAARAAADQAAAEQAAADQAAAAARAASRAASERVGSDAEEGSSAEPADSLDATVAAAGDSDFLAGEEVSSAGWSWMLWVTGLLAVVFGVVKFIQYKSGAPSNSSIRVLASHRLGMKQQLIVVRALGQDHFLCLDGGRTERLASAPASEPISQATQRWTKAIENEVGANEAPQPVKELHVKETKEAAPDAGATAAQRLGAKLMAVAAQNAARDERGYESESASVPIPIKRRRVAR